MRTMLEDNLPSIYLHSFRVNPASKPVRLFINRDMLVWKRL